MQLLNVGSASTRMGSQLHADKLFQYVTSHSGHLRWVTVCRFQSRLHNLGI